MISKKMIYMFICLFLVLVVAYLIAETIELAKYKKTLTIGSEIPLAEFTLVNNQLFSTEQISHSKTALLFFSVACPHCQTELKLINQSVLLDSLNFIFIGKETVNEINEFINQFPALEEKSLIMSDQLNHFLVKFGSSVVPNLFLYEQRRLTLNLKGEFNLKLLVDY